jgi:hypothetical protein
MLWSWRRRWRLRSLFRNVPPVVKREPDVERAIEHVAAALAA